MPLIRYVGPIDEVDVFHPDPPYAFRVRRGVAVDVPQPVHDALVEQHGAWEDAEPTPAAASRRAVDTTPED